MRRSTYTLPLVVSGLLVGCVGGIGDDEETGPDGPDHPQAFECVPGDPSATVLPRLSRAQYVRSLSDLAAASFGEAEADAVVATLASSLTNVPLDGDPDHDRLDQAVSQAHVDGHYHVAVAFATELTRDAARVEALAGACATDADASNDTACLDTFIRGFGLLAHRRPLGDAEVGFYRDEVFAPAVGMDPLAIRDVVTVMVLSPWFLYRVENEGDAIADREGVFLLSDYELASRLSLHFWDGPPDAELLEAAASGALSTDAGYEAEVERLLDHPRTVATMDRFFSEWFELDDLAPLDQSVGNPAYDAFVGSDVPTAELRARLLEDALDLVRWTTWQDAGALDDLFLTDRSFARTADVSALYGGAPIWSDGTTPEPLGGGGRAGILTRPAMLATGSIGTHPTLRGRDILRRVLCDELPPPPADAMDNLPTIDPLVGERGRMEQLTGDGACAGCHGRMDPIGFNLGNFDGLGRLRDQETIYADDGSILAQIPIDTTAASNVDGDSETLVHDAIELSSRIAESGKPEACLARHYFRFAFSRAEDDEVDGCVLESMRDKLDQGEPLRDVLRDIALSETFRTKKLAD